MGSTLEFRQQFVKRLVQACDESKNVPKPGQGRQQYIAKNLKLAPEAISKWFHAVSMPKPDKMEELAKLLDVDQAWLHYGITPEVNRAERRLRAKETSGASYVVYGMIQMAGGYCGEPAENDQRAGYVDFYANLRGKVYPIHVALAREVEDGAYEVILPKEYSDVRTITVLPQEGGRLYFIEMPNEIIEKHKTRKQGAFSIRMERSAASRGDVRFATGEDTWPRIRNFEDFA